jgi:hypothetical protein
MNTTTPCGLSLSGEPPAGGLAAQLKIGLASRALRALFASLASHVFPTAARLSPAADRAAFAPRLLALLAAHGCPHVARAAAAGEGAWVSDPAWLAAAAAWLCARRQATAIREAREHAAAVRGRGRDGFFFFVLFVCLFVLIFFWFFFSLFFFSVFFFHQFSHLDTPSASAGSGGRWRCDGGR